ncbi:unnamed protein product [Pedinophyceae sp. YPF-701]|nr:unnamed protein product [Pedinophyceae sp. YPF-701]
MRFHWGCFGARSAEPREGSSDTEESWKEPWKEEDDDTIEPPRAARRTSLGFLPRVTELDGSPPLGSSQNSDSSRSPPRQRASGDGARCARSRAAAHRGANLRDVASRWTLARDSTHTTQPDRESGRRTTFQGCSQREWCRSRSRDTTSLDFGAAPPARPLGAKHESTKDLRGRDLRNVLSGGDVPVRTIARPSCPGALRMPNKVLATEPDAVWRVVHERIGRTSLPEGGASPSGAVAPAGPRLSRDSQTGRRSSSRTSSLLPPDVARKLRATPNSIELLARF